MIWPQLQTTAEIAIGRILNSLPEGLLIALSSAVMLRLLPRQNSGTRFAVWFVALLTVAGLPFIGIRSTHSSVPALPLVTLPDHWGAPLFLAWITAVFVAMLRLAIGLWHLQVLRRSCIAIDAADLDPTVRKTVADLSSSRSAILATSERVRVPAAIGFFNPVIIIPTWTLRELPPDQLNIILLHEFAHLRRWDDWTNLLQKMVRAVFLFHPAVWWIENRLSLEREMACDDQVLAETANPRGYANCLIALLEKSVTRRGWEMAQAAVHRAHEASLRLAQILDASRPSTSRVWKPALGLVGVFSMVCLVLVPSAPRFVAFDGTGSAIATSDVHSAALNRPQFPSAAVTPASPCASTLPALETTARPHILRTVEHQSEDHGEARRQPLQRSPGIVQAGLNAAAAGTSGVAVKAAAKEKPAPASETLLVVRTTERIGPDAWISTVSVWRITWVNPAQDSAARAPVANKT